MEGSKSISVTITVKDIMDRVQDHSYYLGESVKSDPRFVELGAKVQASLDEKNILTDFINNSISIVCNLVSRALGETSYNKGVGTSIEFTTKAPANTPELKNQLTDYILNYIATYVLEMWLNTVKPDEAQRFTAIRTSLEKEVTLLATQRSKPVR